MKEQETDIKVLFSFKFYFAIYLFLIMVSVAFYLFPKEKQYYGAEDHTQ